LIYFASLPTEGKTLTIGASRLTICRGNWTLIITTALSIFITHTDIASTFITLETILTEEGACDRFTGDTAPQIVYSDPFTSSEASVAISTTINTTDWFKVFGAEALVGY
jgi:hypothetical protein